MAYDLSHITVLIVDDMRPMLSLTKSILLTFGFSNIITAENGEDGYKKYCQHKPDFILTDWLMEPVDGLELTRMVRKNPDSPNPFTPIIMMTGFSSRLRVMKARDHGITEFLVKPFTAKDLYSRVFQIIERPRQFVSTEEFFGPDRRRKRVPDYEGPRRRGEDTGAGGRGGGAPGLGDVTSDILKKLRDDAKNV